MNKILLTGADGLLGRQFAVNCLRMGWEVTGLVKSIPEKPLSGINYKRIDLAGTWSSQYLPPKVDVVVHLAQSEHYRDFPASAINIFRVNVSSTAELLDYARQAGAKKFIYASSGSVYKNNGLKLSENSPLLSPGEADYYSGSKISSEYLVRNYSELFAVVVVRIFFMYGSGQNRNMLIPRLMDNIASGRTLLLQGKDGIRINPIHVKDASAALMASVISSSGGTFNLAGPEIHSFREICELMGKYLNCRPVFEHLQGEPTDLIGDNSVMCKQLFRPELRLADSLEDIGLQNITG